MRRLHTLRKGRDNMTDIPMKPKWKKPEDKELISFTETIDGQEVKVTRYEEGGTPEKILIKPKYKRVYKKPA